LEEEKLDKDKGIEKNDRKLKNLEFKQTKTFALLIFMQIFL